MKVILRPVSANSWPQGLPTKKYRNCYEDIGSYFTRSGRIYTGLTKEDEVRLGELLGENLNSNSDFWKNFSIRTSGKDYYLDLEDAGDELKYLFLKNHKRVKNSFAERKATANFVLVNKDEEARKTNVYNKIRRDAVKSFDALTPDEMRKCLRLYGHNGDTLSNEVVENRLFEIVEGNPQAFLDRWVNNSQRENEVLVEKAISKNIVRRNKNVYKYGTEIIGHSLQETSAFLDNPKNQDVKIAIIKQLESKGTIIDESPIVSDSLLEFDKKEVVSDVFNEELVEAVKAKVPTKKKGDTI